MAAAGDTAALRALWSRGSYTAISTLGYVAAAGDHLDTLEWLLEHGVDFDPAALASDAAACGATAVLQWVWDMVKREDGCDRARLLTIMGVVQESALTRATEDTRTLVWLCDLAGVTFPNLSDDLLPGLAAGAGNLVALRWLVEEAGCPLADLSPAKSAAAGGHLGVLAYLHKAGPAFDESVADMSVCPPSEPAVRDASRDATERWLAEEAGVVTRWARERAEAAKKRAERARGGASGARGAWEWLGGFAGHGALP
jgi:hypothetical protein